MASVDKMYVVTVENTELAGFLREGHPEPVSLSQASLYPTQATARHAMRSTGDEWVAGGPVRLNEAITGYEHDVSEVPA